MIHSALTLFRKILPKRLSHKIIWGVVVVQLVLMLIYAFDLIKRQWNLLNEQSKEQAVSLAQSLAVNAKPDIVSNDLHMLSNQVLSLHDFPNLDYAMLLSADGEVLAHTNPALLGTILKDSSSVRHLKSIVTTIVHKSKRQIDVAVPVTGFNGELIGWARVSLSREHIRKEIVGLINSSIIYLLLALAISTLLAWMIAKKLVNELDVLSKIADKVSTGHVTARASPFTSPEVERLGRTINKMLDDISSNEALLFTVLENLPVGVWLLNNKGDIVSANREGKRIWAGARYVGAEHFGEYKGWHVATGKKIQPDEWAAARVMKTGKPVLNEEIEIECFDSTRKIILNSAVPFFDEDNKIKGGVIINVDITGLREKEKELTLVQTQVDLTDATMKIAFDQSPIGMALVSTEGKLLEANNEFCHILGYTAEEIAKVTMLDISHPGDMQKDMELVMQVLKGEIDNYKIEKRYYRKDKTEVWTNLTVHLVRHKNGSPLYFISQLEDITERKSAEKVLKENEEKFRTLIENLQIGVMKHRPDASIDLSNKAASRIFGLKEDERINQSTFLEGLDVVKVNGEPCRYDEYPVAIAISTGLSVKGAIIGVNNAQNKNRIWLSVDAIPAFTRDGKLDFVISSFYDITEKVNADIELMKTNRLYKFIGSINELILRDSSRDEILQQACQTAVQDGGFRMAWIGLYDEADKKIKPYTWAGHEEGYLGSITITADEKDTGKGPTGRAISYKKYQYCDDIATDPDMLPWRVEALKRNYRSSIALPVIVNGKIEAVFTLYMSQPFFFGHPQEIELLLKVTGDIAYALDKLRLADLQLKIEKDLQVSEEMNRAILNTFPDRIFRIEGNGMIIEVQTGNREGMTKTKDFTGKKITDLTSPATAEKILIALHKALVTRKLITIEYELEEHGMNFFFEGRMIAISDNEVLFIARDITESKQANADLEKSIKEISDLRFALDEGSLVDIADINGVITHINDNFCTIAKYSREELVGQNHRKLNSGYHLSSFFKELWTTILAGKIWRGEVREKAGDGTFFWLDTTIVPFINTEGKPYQFVSIRKDITDRKQAEQELKESEEKFRSLVESTPLGVYILDHRGFKYVSPGFEKMFGYTEEEILKGIKVEELVHPEDREKVLAAIRQKISGEVQNTRYSVKAIRKDGKILYVDLISSRLIYKGQPTSIGAIFDITDKVEEEKRIGKAVNDAQENERLQIGMELHDNVKQIMAASLMSLGFAKDTMNDNPVVAEETIENVRNYIREAIQELRRLSHQLAPSADSNLPLAAKIKMLADNMNSAGSLDIQIDVEDFDEPLHNDIQLTFYRILQEQLSNIFKYAKATMAEITIEKKDNSIQLRIKDNGRGFDTSVKKPGIGLENIKRRVNVLGGTSKIISSPGQGCELLVQVPIS
jgi:PAS domain S-box-containing protein